MAKNIGDRVGAILSADSENVNLFGYGIRLEDEIPVGAGGMGSMLAGAGMKNPTILLDSGEKVFGCECWWASEEEVKSMIADRTVTIISPEKARKE